MQLFDRVDPKSLDRRELHLWILALTVIFVLAIGVALLMYPTVFSRPVGLEGLPVRAVFFGFCGFSVLSMGYFVDRQVVIRNLRRQLHDQQQKVEQIRQQASADLLTTLPSLNHFRDRLAMEYRRASNTRQSLSLLVVELKPSRNHSGAKEIETAYGDAAKTLMRKLRGEDSIFLFASGVFGIVLPSVNARGAYSVRDRLMEGLEDASGASERFSFTIRVVNYPEHVATAREMEESIRHLLPRGEKAESAVEAMAVSTEAK
ncbi:MAG: diguanylate cyclase [Acidobacteriia bacterium]|nr:diguanylate cyclase [Terriglobia bacterium]